MEVHHAGAIGDDGAFLLEQLEDAGVHSGQDAHWAKRYASVAAGIALTQPGASPSIPIREEVLTRMEGGWHDQ